MDGEFQYDIAIMLLARTIECCSNRMLEKNGLTCSQMNVIQFLIKCKKNGRTPVFQKNIESCLKLSNPAVSGILRRLETKGLITRRASFSDNRHKEIMLTEAANELEKYIESFIEHNEKILLEGIPENECEKLKENIYMMLDNCSRFEC